MGRLGRAEPDRLIDVDRRGALRADDAHDAVAPLRGLADKGDAEVQAGAGEELAQRGVVGHDGAGTAQHAQLDPRPRDELGAAGQQAEDEAGAGRLHLDLERAQRQAARQRPREADGDRQRLAVHAIEAEGLALAGLGRGLRRVDADDAGVVRGTARRHGHAHGVSDLAAGVRVQPHGRRGELQPATGPREPGGAVVGVAVAGAADVGALELDRDRMPRQVPHQHRTA